MTRQNTALVHSVPFAIRHTIVYCSWTPDSNSIYVCSVLFCSVIGAVRVSACDNLRQLDNMTETSRRRAMQKSCMSDDGCTTHESATPSSRGHCVSSSNKNEREGNNSASDVKAVSKIVSQKMYVYYSFENHYQGITLITLGLSGVVSSTLTTSL